VQLRSLASKPPAACLAPIGEQISLAAYAAGNAAGAGRKMHVLLVCPGPIRRDDAAVAMMPTRLAARTDIPAGIKLRESIPDWLAAES